MAENNKPNNSPNCEVIIGEAKPVDSSPSESQTGGLIVRTFAAKQALPVDGAAVMVYRPATGDGDKKALLSFVFTNYEGETPKIILPAPNINYSEDPNAQAYSTYYVQINHEGFNTQRDIPVQIFPETTAILPVNLEPIPAEF